MLSKFFTLVVILSFWGCDSKEYKKSANENIDIVSELNQGDSDTVIKKLDSRESITTRQQYYLASALSMKGGIDVYSLYPILEMQLFRKNALEWSNLSKEKNPYLRFLKSQEGIDYEKRLQMREKRWQKYEGQIIKRLNLRMQKPTLEDLNTTYNEYGNYEVNQEQYDKTDQKCSKTINDILARNGTEDDVYNTMYDMDYQSDIPYPYFELCNYYIDQFQLASRKNNYLHPDQTNAGFANVRWEMVYMNILWNTYEAIPMMKQMPFLSETQQNHLSEALDRYKETLKDPEFKASSLKNIAILTGVSLLSVYKNSFNLDEIDSIQDLICSFEPSVLMENYSLIRRRLLFITELKEVTGELGDISQYEQYLESFKQSMPENLTEEEKAHFIEGVENSKINQCFNA